MAISDTKIKEYTKRLLLARMRILVNNGFYGLLLMHLKFSIDATCETAYTDGDRIAFSPKFMDDLSDSELDFVLMHEILHVVLRHCIRYGNKDSELFNIACDIVVNSNIKKSMNNLDEDITLKKYGVGMHLTPDGQEGNLFTAEEVYNMIVSPQNKKKQKGTSSDNDGAPNENANNSSKSKSGKPEEGGNNAKSKGGKTEEGGNNAKSKGGKTEEEGNNAGAKDGKAEENGSGASSKGGKAGESQKGKQKSKNIKGAGIWDDHSRWKVYEEEDPDKDLWIKRVEDATRAIEIREAIMSRGLVPEFARRIIGELRKPQIDWREILNDFVQEEVCDYSFMPPDRRYCGDFFLPDFNEKDFLVKNVLFMVDTSGSMSDREVIYVMSEIKGAIDQYAGKLCGLVGFFDAGIVEPKPFTNLEEFRKIEAAGGGGTDFDSVFDYVNKYMQEDPPVSIIILTDGYAPFPDEKKANGIPVLWLITNSEVNPPWGKVARIDLAK